MHVMLFDQDDRGLLQKTKASVTIPSHTNVPVDEILKEYPIIDQRNTVYFGELGLSTRCIPKSYSFKVR